jgi:putative membrane protein
MIDRSTSGTIPQALFFSFCVVTAFSGIYEVFEWLLTVVMAQHDADAYNGQQGDLWDAQKDIGIAMIGSVIAMPFVKFIRSKDTTS